MGEKKSGCIWGIIVILILFAMIGGCSNSDDGDRTCAWCGGTGYVGNGAKTAVEYVFMKTPCKHCKGTGHF